MQQHRGFSRTERVSEQILRELAELIRSEIKDPRISWVTLTAVEVTRDYSHAKVFYSILESEKKAIIQQALEHAAGHLRSQLGKRISVFSTPQLHFMYDESVERGSFISKLIDDIRQEDNKNNDPECHS